MNRLQAFYPLRRLLVLIYFFFGAATFGLAQSDNMFFTAVEKPPSFPGGQRALWTYLERSVQFPPEAKAANVNGQVQLSFIVEKDGRLSTFTIEQGLRYDCDKEALRVAQAMPNWEPGSQSGALQRVKTRLSIRFGIPYPNNRK